MFAKRGTSSILWAVIGILMRTSSASAAPTRQKLSKIVIPIVLALTLIFVVLGGWYFISHISTPNYAADISTAFSSDLKTAGATKVCATGDTGRGPDNRNPWYQAYYSIPKNEDDTIVVVSSIAAQEGYKVKRATVGNEGPITGVDDRFIDKWYFDDTSKRSPYAALKDGYIELVVTVNADGTDKACGAGRLRIDSSTSVIGLRIQLPDYK
jgi:hypothetical protein